MNDVIEIDDSQLQRMNARLGGLNISGASNRPSGVLRTGKSMAVFAGSTNLRRRNQLNDKHEIVHLLQINTLHKFCTVCECLNLDPLCPHSPLLVFILLSRHRDRVQIARMFLQSSPNAEHVMVDWDAADDLLPLQDKFSSISDWSTLLAYTDVAIPEDTREDICGDAYLSRFCDCLREAGLGDAYPTTIEFAMRCILHMSPAKTPSSKMLERFMITITECRDIEMRCLRAVTAYADQSNDDDKSADTFLRILQHTVVVESFADDVRHVITAQKEIKRQEELENVSMRRPRLRDLVISLHNENTLEYQQTFESWCVHKKFSNTTGLNVQRLLYFINAQQCKVDLQHYSEYFTQGLINRLSLQHISTIDADVVVHIILSLRVYQRNIEHLIDFRTRCLEGLSIGTRKNLSLAQVLQLYVCCYQHESIRDKCWKAVLPVLNHSIQTACAKFREQYEFEVHAVINSIMACHVQRAASAPPR